MFTLMSRIFIIASFCFVSLTALSQESRAKFIGIEFGGDMIAGELPKNNFIRPNGYYSGDSYNNGLSAFTKKAYGGVTGEVRSRSGKFGLSAGVRFSRIDCTLGRGWLSTSDHFYVLVEQTQNSLEYAKVKEISEASSYLGVPIALSWYPFRERLFTMYFKAAIEMSVRLNTKTTVEFADSSMEGYRDVIVDRMEAPRDIIGTLSPVAGIKIGRSSRVAFRIEVGPSVFLNDRTSGITNAFGGFGAQFNLQFAL
jgi:hypothetical protein